MTRSQPKKKGRPLGSKTRSSPIPGRGELTAMERLSIRELKTLVRSQPGRHDVRDEIVARLVVLIRKGWVDLETIRDDPGFWDSDVAGNLRGYLGELRRWLAVYRVSEDGPSDIDDEIERIQIDLGSNGKDRE